MASPLPSAAAARMWTPTPARCMTPAELDEFAARQMQFHAHKQARVQALESQFYPSAPRADRIGGEQLERSAARQCDQELQLREQRAAALAAKYSPAPPKATTMAAEAIDGMAKRMHDQATVAQARRRAAVEQAKKAAREGACAVQKGRRLTTGDVKAVAVRLCVPKKEMSYEEMNRRLFGKAVALPEEYVARAKALEAQNAARRAALFKKPN